MSLYKLCWGSKGLGSSNLTSIDLFPFSSCYSQQLEWPNVDDLSV